MNGDKCKDCNFTKKGERRLCRAVTDLLTQAYDLFPLDKTSPSLQQGIWISLRFKTVVYAVYRRCQGKNACTGVLHKITFSRWRLGGEKPSPHRVRDTFRLRNIIHISLTSRNDSCCHIRPSRSGLQLSY